jgi:hypothetical protein
MTASITAHHPATAEICSPEQRITRSLLGYGVIAGPFYLITAVAQTLTRTGFDPTRHAWSQLANGGPGWIQIVNLILTGLMTTAFAVGLRRSLQPGLAATWAPRLIGVYGLSLVAAGVFRADPGNGFPVGTPDGPGPVSWHGTVHFAAGAIGFTALAVASFVLARRYRADGRRGWALGSRLVGAALILSFAAMAAGGGAPFTLLAFTGAVVLVFGWITAVAVDRYRTR